MPPAIIRSLVNTPARQDDEVGTGLIGQEKGIELRSNSQPKVNLMSSNTKTMRTEQIRGIEQAKRMLFSNEEVSLSAEVNVKAT
jgi:hypothetical protein